MNITVGDIRKAIEGLPDDSVVLTHTHFGDDFSDFVDDFSDEIDAKLAGFRQEEGHCVVQLEVRELDPYDDDEDEDEDEDDEEESEGR